MAVLRPTGGYPRCWRLGRRVRCAVLCEVTAQQSLLRRPLAHQPATCRCESRPIALRFTVPRRSGLAEECPCEGSANGPCRDQLPMGWTECLAVRDSATPRSAATVVDTPLPQLVSGRQLPESCSSSRCLAWFGLSFGCLPRSRPLAFATFMASRVRSRIRSDSNSATIANTVEQRPPHRVGRIVD